MVCKGVLEVVEEHYTETEKECQNTTKKLRICPKECDQTKMTSLVCNGGAHSCARTD